jgi:hypothetical protein
MIVMLLGRPVSDMAENQRSIADVLWVVDGDGGRGAITEQVRRNASAESCPCMFYNSARKRVRVKLRSDFRNPDGIEI